MEVRNRPMPCDVIVVTQSVLAWPKQCTWSWSFLLACFRPADGVEAVPPARKRPVLHVWRVGFHPDRVERTPKEKTMRRREFERLLPVMASGGHILTVDHQRIEPGYPCSSTSTAPRRFEPEPKRSTSRWPPTVSSVSLSHYRWSRMHGRRAVRLAVRRANCVRLHNQERTCPGCGHARRWRRGIDLYQRHDGDRQIVL